MALMHDCDPDDIRQCKDLNERFLQPGQSVVIASKDEEKYPAIFNGYAYPFTDEATLEGSLL